MPDQIIRRIRLAHCKRGPSRCEKCREMDVERICLLDVSLPRSGEMQRRVVQVRTGGEDSWREFDVIRVFVDEQGARAYAAAHAIEDVVL